MLGVTRVTCYPALELQALPLTSELLLFRLHRAEGGRPLGRCQAASILTTIAFATLY